MPSRLLLVVLLVLGVCWLPWWLSLIILLAALFWQGHFYEALLPAFIFDLLYGLPLAGPLRFLRFGATLLTLLLILLMVWVKKFVWL